jgi:hypothetical protein
MNINIEFQPAQLEKEIGYVKAESGLHVHAEALANSPTES